MAQWVAHALEDSVAALASAQSWVVVYAPVWPSCSSYLARQIKAKFKQEAGPLLTVWNTNVLSIHRSFSCKTKNQPNKKSAPFK